VKAPSALPVAGALFQFRAAGGIGVSLRTDTDDAAERLLEFRINDTAQTGMAYEKLRHGFVGSNATGRAAGLVF
jgi:hypothetical protein